MHAGGAREGAVVVVVVVGDGLAGSLKLEGTGLQNHHARVSGNHHLVEVYSLPLIGLDYGVCMGHAHEGSSCTIRVQYMYVCTCLFTFEHLFPCWRRVLRTAELSYHT